MEQAELRQLISDLSIDLGRVPLRDEAARSIPALKYHLEKMGITYTQMLMSCGLESPMKKAKKIDNSIFNVNLERHLESYTPTIYKPPIQYPRIASISDIHWPFSCKRVLEAFYKFIEKFQPEYVILNGDAWDMYSHSKYPRSHNIFTPRDEQQKCHEENTLFWLEVKKRCHNTKCTQLLGNHDTRPLKRIMETYPEAEDWVKQKMTELFTYEGVTTFMDPREELIIADIAIFHGYRGGLGDHRD